MDVYNLKTFLIPWSVCLTGIEAKNLTLLLHPRRLSQEKTKGMCIMGRRLEYRLTLATDYVGTWNNGTSPLDCLQDISLVLTHQASAGSSLSV